jgi:predicted DNA-binding antitoxin AbrB/MazE fold protein
MTHNVDAIYDQGVLRPLEPLILPEGTRVHLRIEEENAVVEAKLFPGGIHGPRLAHPEQAAEFNMEIREIKDAGV